MRAASPRADEPTPVVLAPPSYPSSTPLRTTAGSAATADSPLDVAVSSEVTTDAVDGPRSLRGLLLAGDALALTLVWLPLHLVDRGPGLSLLVMLEIALSTVLITLGVMSLHRLYRARVASIRSIELQYQARAVAIGALASLWARQTLGAAPSVPLLLLGAALALLALAFSRSAFRSWLGAQRRLGRHTRPVLLVGQDADEAAGVLGLLEEHPELGYRAVGLVSPTPPREAVGDRAVGGGSSGVPWRGPLHEVVAAAESLGAQGAIVVTSGLSSRDLNDAVRALLRSGLHVHLSSGLQGIAARRVRMLPLAHEPLFYLEQPSVSRWQLSVKRVIDVGAGGILLLLTLPLLALAAVATKITSQGPVLFHQQRVGRGGVAFGLLKLRTMIVDAEGHLEALRQQNERVGPLFKVANDPRVTPVGRLLRATSIDELPQLVNVIRGDMSLVGPRPALPGEAAQFDDGLRARERMRPGLTGLWQVEARDNPSFGPYRRLDLFYVENWSLGLDLGVLFATVYEVLRRTLVPLVRLVPVGRARAQPAAYLD